MIVLGAAVCLMAVLVARLGPTAILAQLGSAGPGAIWLVVVYALGTAIGAVPWYLLLPRAGRPPLRAAVASRFAASGANALLPLLGLGGEPLRLMWMRKGDVATGVAAIVIDRLLYAIASALFLLAGVLAVTRLAQFPRGYLIVGAAAGLGLLLASGIAIWLVSRHRMAAWFHRLLRRLRGRAAPGDRELGPAVDDVIAAIRTRHGTLAGALLLHVVGRVVLGAEVYVGFMLLEVPLAWDVALVFATVPVLLSLVGAIVPSQIGIQESTQALVATALGLSPVTAVAVVLLQRIRQLVTGAIAWLLIVINRRPAAPPGPAS